MTYSRWHRFDSNGIKHIKKFNIEESPTPLTEEGYSEWRRGTGPHDPIAYENLRNFNVRRWKGVPKSPEQKQKMRDAKLGVPKTEEHKANMRKSHQQRKKNNESSKICAK